MDDAMLDLMADHGGLRRRLDAYAEARLSPDLTASARMRSRVLAVAHRQSALARPDATLALIADPTDLPGSEATGPAHRGLRTAVRRMATVLLAASLALASVSTVALAARPGGGLYDVRVWAETLTLSSDPATRAVQELDRLEARLAEIEAATLQGDDAALAASLAAYQRIVDEATINVLASDDEIAAVVLEEGVANNIQVLTALIARLPEGGSEAVGRALERAIERSNEAIESFEPAHGSGGDGGAGGNGNGGGTPGGPNATPAPVATEAPPATATLKPTKEPKPTATPKSTATPAPPEPTAPPAPEPTPKPGRTPPPTPEPGGGGNGPGETGGGQRTPPADPPGPGD